MPLARHLARRYRASDEAEDLEQVASLALVKAVDRYDPSRGIAFTSFAVPTIVGELKRYFRDLGWSVRVPRSLQEFGARVEHAVEELRAAYGRTPTTFELAEHLGETIERVLEARSISSAHRADSLDRPTDEDGEVSRGSLIGSVDAEFERIEAAADVERMLDRLPGRMGMILRLRFGEDLVQREIADRVGISQMQVSRQIRDALELLRADAEAGDLARRPTDPSIRSEN